MSRMRISRLIIAMTICLIGTTAWAQEMTDEIKEVRQAIDTGNQNWIKAWETNDVELLMSIFAEDGVMLSDDGVYYRGREEIGKQIKAIYDSVGPVKTTVETMDVWLLDGIAYETGKYSYTIKRKNGETFVTSGKYVVQWKKIADGSWKINMDVGLADGQ